MKITEKQQKLKETLSAMKTKTKLPAVLLE